MYLPRYMQMLRDRTEVPRVVNVDNIDRVILLPGEDEEATTAIGRPIGGEYYEPQRKLDFMDTHGIEMSVLSTANPWVDFLAPEEAIPMAQGLNEDLQQFCEDSNGRFYGFGVIPTTSIDGCLEEVHRIKKLDKLRGVVLSTHGRGLYVGWCSAATHLADRPSLCVCLCVRSCVRVCDAVGSTTLSCCPCGRKSRRLATWYSSILTMALATSISATTATRCSSLSDSPSRPPLLYVVLDACVYEPHAKRAACSQATRGRSRA